MEHYYSVMDYFQGELMTAAAILISTFALLFTIWSFWWQNWRSGKLIIGPPRTYAAFVDKDQVVMHLPLVFFNSGPKPKLIENLKIEIEGYPLILVFTAVVTDLASASADKKKWALQFPLHGNKAETIICEFSNLPNGFQFEAKEYRLRLLAIMNEDDDWTCLKSFILSISKKSITLINGKSFTVHDNHKWDN